MKVYQNAYTREDGDSGGFTYHATRKDAETVAKQKRRAGHTAITRGFTLSRQKKDFVRFLNIYASHPDNG